jgi:hypothetical protein
MCLRMNTAQKNILTKLLSIESFDDVETISIYILRCKCACVASCRVPVWEKSLTGRRTVQQFLRFQVRPMF